MLYPLGEPAFITLPACGVHGAFEATILSVTADELTGADEVSFRAAWLGPGERLEIGAAALSRLEEPFEPAADSSGLVASCAEMPNTLEIAVVLPEADDTAVVVDGFTVDYTVGPDEYTATPTSPTACVPPTRSTRRTNRRSAAPPRTADCATATPAAQPELASLPAAAPFAETDREETLHGTDVVTTRRL